MITLTELLKDGSKELGETTLNTTTNRIYHANDAVFTFFNEKKFSFMRKMADPIAVVADTKRYSLAAITDMRTPGGLYLVKVGTSWDDSSSVLPTNETKIEEGLTGNYCYIDYEENELVFSNDLTVGHNIYIKYYFIPERIEDTASVETFPVPARFRKPLGLLLAANVQYARYLTSEGNSKYNQYENELDKVVYSDAELHTNQVRKIQHPLARLGFRRTYPH